jgi:hypothetical protein
VCESGKILLEDQQLFPLEPLTDNSNNNDSTDNSTNEKIKRRQPLTLSAPPKPNID